MLHYRPNSQKPSALSIEASNVGANANGIAMTGDENHVWGLVINRFSGAGIQNGWRISRLAGWQSLAHQPRPQA